MMKKIALCRVASLAVFLCLTSWNASAQIVVNWPPSNPGGGGPGPGPNPNPNPPNQPTNPFSGSGQFVLDKDEIEVTNSGSVILVRNSSTPKKVTIKKSFPYRGETCDGWNSRQLCGHNEFECGMDMRQECYPTPSGGISCHSVPTARYCCWVEN